MNIVPSCRKNALWPVAVLAPLLFLGCASMPDEPVDMRCVVSVLGGAIDGVCTSGTVTRVDLALSESGSSAFLVGVSGIHPRLLLPSVQDSLWVAAYAASRMTERPLAGCKIDATAHVPIEGSSAGLALALGVASALEGRSVPADFSATGEILPNGVVGPVGGIAAKIAAAARSGIRRVAVPTIPASDLVDGRETDFVEWGARLGVDVRRVRTLGEAWAWMRGESWREPSADEAKALALPSPVAAALARQTTDLEARIVAQGNAAACAPVEDERRAGRLFSAWRLALAALAQRNAAAGLDAPKAPADALDARIEPWLSPALDGMDEMIRQQAEQGAPAAETEVARRFTGWMRALERESAAPLADACAACGADALPGDAVLLSALGAAVDDLFETLRVKAVAEAGNHGRRHVRNMFYRADNGLLVGDLTASLIAGGKLPETPSRMAWRAAGACAAFARHGGNLNVEEDKSGSVKITYGCADYLALYIEESRKAALLAIADARAKGAFPAVALDAFEKGERLRPMLRTDLNAGLSAYEAYLRAFLLVCCTASDAGRSR